jgi:DNA-directed RNA polymerase specialized sigma24 family protein
MIPRPTRVTTNHEIIFIERYPTLLGSALQLTDGNRERAEDLVHDAFVQFSLSQPDITAIENLGGYLYGMLRKLHLSQMRRDSRSRIHPHFLVEYDSVETGLHLTDPRDRLQARDELRRVCRYACARKETSKAGSVLILRFFHGYFPSEITKVIRGSRQAVDLRLRRARAEAKVTLTNPDVLVLMKERTAFDFKEQSSGESTIEFLAELRRTIFGSRRGDCLSPEQLESSYGPYSESPINCEALAHIVSCRACLDQVNRICGLPLLAERYAVDTMGKDESSKGGGPGQGTGNGADDLGVARCRRRAREVFEHRPQELHISVNGFIQGSQTVNSEQSEQTLDIDLPEQIGFIEVFSEQETRLLFFDVELPPSGTVEQTTRVELSNERTLELTLSFRGRCPTLHTIYRDPLLKAGCETEADLEREPPLTEPSFQHARENARERSWQSITTNTLAKLNRGLGSGAFWLRPSVVTAIAGLLLIGATLFLYLRGRPSAVATSDLLERSIQAEQAIALKPDTVLHLTLQVEERSAGGDLIARNRIEIWQSAQRGIVARRLYNEKNNLIAGDWRSKDGVQTLYQHGVRPQSQRAPEARDGPVAIAFQNVWQQSVTAEDFAALIGGADRARVEERQDTYIVHYANDRQQHSVAGLIRASLVIRRSDLHPVELTLTVGDGKELREYGLRETAFERRAFSAVESSVFEPEPELVGPSGDRVKAPSKPARYKASETLTIPVPVAATAELEVEVLRLIQEAQADMGEQVSVTRGTEGILRVEGIFETDQRKAEVLRQLQPVMSNPAVRVDVQTVSEALTRQSQSRPAAAQVVIQSPPPTANKIPVEDELRRYFATRRFKDAQIDEEIRRFSNRMLDESREAMAHAWALKRLSDRFSSDQLAALDTGARRKWLALIGAHAQALTQQTASLRQELQLIFPSQNADNTTEEIELSSKKDLSSDINRLFDLCSQYTQVLRSAFIISSGETNATVVGNRQFWRSLKQAENLATMIQKATRV